MLPPDPLAGYKGRGVLLRVGRGGRTGGKGKGGGERREGDLLLRRERGEEGGKGKEGKGVNERDRIKGEGRVSPLPPNLKP